MNKLYFRKKEDLQIEKPFDQNLIKKDQIFIKQIDEIDRYKKEEIIEEAIIDYLCRDIEMSYLITGISIITREDFKAFENKCFQKWREVSRRFITKSNIDEYTLEELNNLAIKIYDEIMQNLKVDFKESFGFNDSNKYIQNGTFLNLSDSPKIGWHPKWQEKYLKN